MPTLNNHTFKKKLTPYLLMAPAIICMFWVVIYPICSAVNMSLWDYNLARPKDTEFVGLGNYIELFQDDRFLATLPNTLYWVAFCLVFQCVIGFLCAVLLSKDFRGRGFARTVSLLPWVMPMILITLMWKWMYDGNYGIINDIMMKIGLIDSYKAWLSSPTTALTAVAIVKTWQGIPFFAIMILAALQTIPDEIYEAARVDGATAWQRFWHITLPYVMPVTLITILLRTIWIANDVDVVYLMTGGGPVTSTLTLSVYAYQTTMLLDFGKASSIAILFTVIIMVPVAFYLKQIQKAEAKFS
jgi:multiple sugar transport system permease protein